jgi:hypothetical protein
MAKSMVKKVSGKSKDVTVEQIEGLKAIAKQRPAKNKYRSPDGSC